MLEKMEEKNLKVLPLPLSQQQDRMYVATKRKKGKKSQQSLQEAIKKSGGL